MPRYNPEQIAQIRQHQREFLAREKARTKPVTYTIERVTVQVNPSVFPPATDTRLLATHVRTKPGERTLEMTAGSGIISLIAGLQGASGYAVDINPTAVQNAQENFSAHSVSIRAIRSNMFEFVPAEQFDQIFANGPFFDDIVSHPLDHACYGATDFINKLLAEVPKYLKQTGKLLVVMAEWTNLANFENAALKNDLTFKVVGTKNSDDNFRTYRLYEVRRRINLLK